MLTTVTIDDDVLEAVQEMAESSGRAVGAVLSELVRTSLPSKTKATSYRRKNKLATFRVPPNAEMIPSDRAAQLLAEEMP